MSSEIVMFLHGSHCRLLAGEIYCFTTVEERLSGTWEYQNHDELNWPELTCVCAGAFTAAYMCTGDLRTSFDNFWLSEMKIKYIIFVFTSHTKWDVVSALCWEIMQKFAVIIKLDYRRTFCHVQKTITASETASSVVIHSEALETSWLIRPRSRSAKWMKKKWRLKGKDIILQTIKPSS